MLRQEDKPHLAPVEKGRRIAPQYDTPLDFFDVTTADWRHVCSARFGPGRPCSFDSKTLWTGDSYRYDIFRQVGLHRDFMALRWWNGSGEGWLIAEEKGRSEVCLLAMIADMPVEERRWDACHFLWETAHKSELAGGRSEAHRYAQAFVEGRLKKRRRKGTVRVEIVPAFLMKKA
jgi:hypothetical protein